MQIVSQIEQLRQQLQQVRLSEKKIALVPTMGALHQGHSSLITRAVKECDFVVVSIFVNPLQFAPNEDLAQYPRTLEADSQLCQELGVELIFTPSSSEIGITGDTETQNNTTVVVPPEEMTSVMCGKYRPGHFTGVATIVTKLLNIVQPDRAYFGQKDAQQLAIIKRLVKDLNLDVTIVGCPIIRDASGLALSSRNQYLSATEKEQATIISRSLQQAAIAFRKGETNAQTLIKTVENSLTTVPAVRMQYVELLDPITLQFSPIVTHRGLLAIAAYLGTTRLIDNMILHKPIVAIDGPAGAGKSTVTRKVAQELGLIYLDTGAMYRAVTWLVMDRGIAITEEKAIAELVKDVKIDLLPPSQPNLPVEVYINKLQVTEAIRTPEVTANVSTISAQAAVREKLVAIQQSYGEKGGIIAEGRDIGTNVFPHAELKIFLTATPQERAKRRLLDLQDRGYKNIDLQQLEAEIIERDRQDSQREIAPLKKAADAKEIITDKLSIVEVVQKIVVLYTDIPTL